MTWASAETFGVVDPVVCEQLKAAPPLPPAAGVATTPEGDLYVQGQLLWDCPPYGS